MGGMVFHHEQAAAPRHPSRLFFYCQREATTGGATGIAPSWKAMEALKASYPEFLEAVRSQGVHYHESLPADAAPDAPTPRSWKTFFGASTREEVERRMTELGYTWSWEEGGDLRVVSPRLNPARTVPGPLGPATDVFFFSLTVAVKPTEFGKPALYTFGDGTVVPLEPLRAALDACEANAVDLHWKAGDVCLVDNMTVLHARRVYEGPRRVLVSMVS